ncbi:MAG: antitoxin Xre/MbcA/ParS toxin-binding domain-containing protein [Bacteroidia bacterium]|jgi:putative toxin-antitoxin system antitoxin component (TIGR02293 family)
MGERKLRAFSPEQGIKKAGDAKQVTTNWHILKSEGKEYVWDTKMDRIDIIRQGLPYASIEVIGKRINAPVKDVLEIFGMPQTTYNKKRREHSMLSGRDSELILLLTELIDYGVEVFNKEEDKFQRWLKKPNVSLGGHTPEQLFDSATGIQEVRNSLNRLEYGNLA